MSILFSNLLYKHHSLVEYSRIGNIILISRTVLVLLMELILHAMYRLQLILDIGIVRDTSLRTSWLYATLSSYFYMFYQVGKALHMIKGYYQMPYIDMTLIFYLGSIILVMQDIQTLNTVWYHIEE
jgi:hypothetical protein